MSALLGLDLAGPSLVPLVLVLLLAAPLTAVLSRHPLRLVGFGSAMVFSLDSAVLAFVLWICSAAVWTHDGPLPGGAVVVGALAFVPWLLGYVAAEATARQRRPAVRAYNIGLSALAGLLFVATALAVRSGVAFLVTGNPSEPAVGVWDLAAVVVASSSYVAVDLLLSALWVARVEGGRVRDALADPAGLVGAATVLAVNSTAVLAALLVGLAPWALVLLAPVAVAMVQASRTGTLALTEHARARSLYRAAVGCQQAKDRDGVVAAIVESASVATAAPARISTAPPAEDQAGCSFVEGTGHSWLVVGPRANRHDFLDGDKTAVATLAALAEQSLARLEAVERIRWVADHDALTGVLTRGAFMTAVARDLTPATSVLFCDVDRFKAVNDTYGHRTGDQVLVAVAARLTEVVGERGTVGRLGGDEFVVLLPDTTPARTERVRTEVLDASRLEVTVGAERLPVGLSTGVAAVADLGPRAVGLAPDDLAEALLERADARMYADKRAGRDQPVPR